MVRPEVELLPRDKALAQDWALVAVHSDQTSLREVAQIAGADADWLEDRARQGEVSSRRYKVSLLHIGPGRAPLLLVGSGPRPELDSYYLMRVVAAASRWLTGRGYSRLAVIDPEVADPETTARAIVQGACFGAYDAGLKKTEKETTRTLDRIAIVSSRLGSNGDAGARQGRAIGSSVGIARDLVNTPPNELTPQRFTHRACELGTQRGLACEILTENDLLRRGFGALLGVAQGSAEPPCVFTLRYGDASAPVHLAVVGKGLTFDSGGLSLKPAEGMESMKGDMAGAAAVVASLLATAELAPPNICVTGVVGTTENMPGGKAMRPGDVLTALNGETIEVLNTDAEGRLVLADVLAYAVQQHPTHIVDLATLTGSAIVSLGNQVALAVGRSPSWVQEVVSAAASGFERAWPMPLYPEYRENMDSEIADIKNSGPRHAGALNAAAFLADFVTLDNWAHLDIAGPAWNDEKLPYAAKGGTGFGVSTVVSLVLRLASNVKSSP